jgi:hypothetical protein
VKTIYKSLIFIIFITFYPLTTVSSFEGPLQVKNLYPIFLHANQPYLEKADIENSMSYSLSHSSTYTVQESSDWVIHLDMEVTELNFRYKRVIKNVFEFDMDIPILILGGGFMDGFLEDYHRTFDFPDYGRSDRPHNEFLYEVKRDGNLIIRGKSGTKFGDIRLAIKKPFSLIEGINLSIKGEIEIPVSSAKEGYSNGSLDAGVSVMVDKKLSDNTMTYWNLGVVFPGDVKGHEKIDLKNFIYGGASLETMVWQNLSLLVQLQGQSSIYPETGISAVDGKGVLLALGGRYNTGEKNFELSLTEDLNTSGAPDFILNFTYKVSL